ncbi:MAG: hypothetical protein QNK31_11120 [Porticoccus sp.]|nr:hypothetical protein [Porticoccus sp.]
MLNNHVKDKRQCSAVIVSAMLLLTTTLLPLPTFAEETGVKPVPIEAKKAESQPVELKPKTEATSAAKAKSRPSEREFDPSEEISEDLSVPFPVDI